MVDGGGVDGVADLLDFSVESIVVVSGVVDFPDGAVSFFQCIVPLDNVTFPSLVLALRVTSVAVMDAVFKSVVRRSL